MDCFKKRYFRRAILTIYNRYNNIIEDLEAESLFLLGPRQTGKTTWLRKELASAVHFNLLDPGFRIRSAEFPVQFLEEARFAIRKNPKVRIVFDEIQKIPALLDPIQELMVSAPDARFLLTGSCARKLRRSGMNLLGGRAGMARFCPLTLRECQSWEGHTRTWNELLTSGGLPRAVLAKDPTRILASYADIYLTEEVAAEGLVRNIPEFANFLRVAAATNANQIVFEKLASDIQMTSKSVRNWFQILEDTLLGEMLKPFSHTVIRKPLTSAKFFFFDCGVANYLRGANLQKPNSEDSGVALENLIYMELKAQISTFRKQHKLFYWRSQSKAEVDFIVTDSKERPILAIEVKSTDRLKEEHTKGIKAFAEEFPNIRKIIVFTGKRARFRVDGIEAWPVEQFLLELDTFL